MVKAIWEGAVIAESDETVVIEGNHYFPPISVKEDFLKESDHKTVCHWKGECNYFDVVVGEKENPNAAFTYKKPIASSIDLVGKDYSDYVSFWHGVEVQRS